MGTHDFKANKVPLLLENQGISMFRGLLRRNWHLCQHAVITAMSSSQTSMSVPNFVRIERGSDGTHDFKLKKVHLFAQRHVNMIWSLLARN